MTKALSLLARVLLVYPQKPIKFIRYAKQYQLVLEMTVSGLENHLLLVAFRSRVVDTGF